MFMKIRYTVLAALGLCLMAGCASNSKPAYASVMAGMSRNNLRFYFGEPSRVEPTAAGGETWYYRFSSWQAQPTGSSGTSDDFGQQTSYVSASVDFSKHIQELPVHISSDGFVIEPVPKGKVVKD
jgi:outer membrane protein assembly factor BamE (lipoprotein component of BamABCDE complex)